MYFTRSRDVAYYMIHVSLSVCLSIHTIYTYSGFNVIYYTQHIIGKSRLHFDQGQAKVTAKLF